MGFWIFMIAVSMVTPGLMIVIGHVFVKHPPKTINDVYGYRTSMSRKNQQTWDFAHYRCGKLWQKMGWGMCFFTLAAALPVRDKGDTVVSLAMGIWICLQCVVMVLSIPLVERDLKKRFDRNGNVRT